MEIRVTVELGEKTLGILGKLFNVNQVLIGKTAEPTEPIAPVTPTTTAAPVTPTVPTAAVPTAPVTPTVPTSAPSFTLDDITKAGVSLMDMGKQGELQALLAEFGVVALPALPQDKYGEFANRLRALGAKI